MHELPNLRAVNFVIDGLLGDGVAASTRFDPQAKALGEWLRAPAPRHPGGAAVTVHALDAGSPRRPQYAANRERDAGALAELDAEHAKALAGGGEKYVARHRKRGKLLPRERIELLLDPDSPFLELSPLAAWGTDFPVGASVVTGIGVVEGVECVLIANDPTVRGGASNPWTLKKTLRAMQIARENRLPLINLVESGGADLPTQKEIFIPGGQIFRDLTRLSAAGIPTIALVFGNSTAGGAYVPGMSDHVVMVEGGAKVFLGGPPLVQDGHRRGRRRRGARRRGDARPGQRPGRLRRRRRARRAADRPADRRPAELAQARPGARRRRSPPRYDADELLGIVGTDLSQPVRPARGAGPDRRRLRLRRVQAALRAAAW